MGTFGHKSPRLEETAISDRGVLVVGHGTQDSAGLVEFHAVVRQVAERLAPTPVEPCFLEFAEPTIADGVDRLIERGAGRIIVAPLVLFAAGHAQRDIPEAVIEAVGRHYEVKWRQTPHLGCADSLVQLSVRRFREVCPTTDAEMLLLFVGRGSRDSTANAELRRFAELRFSTVPVGRLETAFVALAEPSLESSLEAAGRSEFRQIVVQPHLLFAGVLVDRVRSLALEAAKRFPDRRWAVTGHLGVADELIDAVVANIAAARF